MRFNTFDEVAKWYAATKPIISKNHTLADDVRPLGQRRYKWERIVKVDDNTYALTDGSWSEMSYNGSHPNEREYNRKTAAILWERRDDGEYISIRGCMSTGYSMSRYAFYNKYLPQQMRHTENTRQGEHWISNNGERYTLPKIPYSYDYQAKTIGHYEDKSLVFKREGDKFVRVGEITIKSKRIDKDAKAEIRPHIKKFYDWMQTIAPMVAHDWSARSEYAKLMLEHKMGNSEWEICRLSSLKGEGVKQILMDEQHPCRVALVSLFLNRMDVQFTAPTRHAGKHERIPDDTQEWGYRWEYVEGRDYTPEETAAWYVKEAKRVRSSFNRLMNKALDIYATETV